VLLKSTVYLYCIFICLVCLYSVRRIHFIIHIGIALKTERCNGLCSLVNPRDWHKSDVTFCTDHILSILLYSKLQTSAVSEIEFSTFSPEMWVIWQLVATILMISLRINWTKFVHFSIQFSIQLLYVLGSVRAVVITMPVGLPEWENEISGER